MKDQTMREKIIKLLYDNVDWPVEDTADAILALFESEKSEIEKAYGRCRLCYGKGYATRRYATTTSSDLPGDVEYTSPFKVHMEFCGCDRGKQLEELINDIRQKIGESK